MKQIALRSRDHEMLTRDDDESVNVHRFVIAAKESIGKKIKSENLPCADDGQLQLRQRASSTYV
jgi:hypothetical protein